MLNAFVACLLVLFLSVGFAQAKGTKHAHHQVKKASHVHRHKAKTAKHLQQEPIPHENTMPLCAEGQQVNASCGCGTDACGRPFMCQEGEWCRTLAHAALSETPHASAKSMCRFIREFTAFSSRLIKLFSLSSPIAVSTRIRIGFVQLGERMRPPHRTGLKITDGICDETPRKFRAPALHGKVTVLPN
jgi:hypothetical protein